MSIHKQPYITRKSASAEAYLVVRTPAPWRLFVGLSPDSIDYAHPVLEGEDAGRVVLPASLSQRQYFAFESGEVNIILAEQKLPLEGGYNFRDLGGARSQDGGQVVWGKLFRADDMVDLRPHDLHYLASIPIVSIVDFRTVEEAEWAPDKLPEGVRNVYPYHIVPGGIDSLALQNLKKGGNVAAYMQDIYRELVVNPAIVKNYASFFKLVVEADKLPLLFHCSAGKDRTGWAAAMLYFALGVSKEDIMADYMLSADYIAGKYPDGNERFTVKPEYLEAAVDQAERGFGSMENYLTQALKLDLAALRKQFLE